MILDNMFFNVFGWGFVNMEAIAFDFGPRQVIQFDHYML